MALVTITGFPASGKSRRAQQLLSHFETRFQSPSYAGPKLKVLVISDEGLNIPRSAYNGYRSEKPARSALITATQRNMNKDTIVILDSMNYIKGFRYQLYCAAKEAGVRVCTVFVAATPDKCKEWNLARDESQSYTPETLDNLIMRYEEPSSMVRWDSPLLTVPWDEEGIPSEEIWQAVTTGDLKPANAGTRAASHVPVDALQSLENTTATLVSMITTEQASTGGTGGIISLLLPTVRLRLQLPSRNVTMSELQRLKRAFVGIHKKAITLGATEKGSVDFSEESVGDKFVEYLQQNLRQ
ncbi:chromatin associated protein KTI12 [Gautieria morchelliformis]|nr:chromatin associated protein KTI12 [Gautieria morchelliformis]